MKNVLFYIILILEFLLALLMMGWMFADFGALIYLVSSVVLITIMSLFFNYLKKETDEKKRRKIRHQLLLVMLIPTVVGLCLVAFVVISLMIYY
jgi:amino acid transporter